MGKLLSAAVLAISLSQCGTEMTEQTTTETDVVFATNVGGGAYLSSDGIRYAAETGISGGTVATLDGIKGSQDPTLYQTYRVGDDIKVSQPLPNGQYNVILHFAEPLEIGGGERLFDVIINGRKRVASLDVMGWRDGKILSGLTIASDRVDVSDGLLEVTFEALEREPILSAVVVRKNAPRAADWKLVWQDEFDYEGQPNPEKWSHNLWPAKKVNDEDQTYTDRLENVRVEDGHLVIEARREALNDADYTSGRIHTAGKGDFLYGRFEIKAKVPRGQGTWPAIWMLPSDPFKYATTCEPGEDWQGSATCDAWPNSGEIDILEHVGYQMGHVHGTVHNRAYYWVNWEQRKGRIIDDTVDEEFHVYALEWSEDRIDIFVDDALYFTYMNEGTGWEAWPYDHEFHLIINIAMGGVWGRAGGPTDDAALPQKLYVDYVRVYQRGSE
ncbi:MAG: family 16 glycosylhydrolase [Pseudomonadota bacterium]